MKEINLYFTYSDKNIKTESTVCPRSGYIVSILYSKLLYKMGNYFLAYYSLSASKNIQLPEFLVMLNGRKFYCMAQKDLQS